MPTHPFRKATGRRRGLDYLEIGEGPPIVILQGFGTRRQTYLPPARLLAPRCRVIIPKLFAGRGRWTPETTLEALAATLDELDIERASFIGHSFGGALGLEFADLNPSRVVELVFIDTLAMSREWTLAKEAATHPLRLLWMATPSAARDFLIVAAAHPHQLIRAAWWGFTSDRRQQTEAVARHPFPIHVLWAGRDSLLSRPDGRDFAHDLGASFTVVGDSEPRPIDHDWMYRHPKLLAAQLDRLTLQAFSANPSSG